VSRRGAHAAELRGTLVDETGNAVTAGSVTASTLD
jgi:hypothetical protein